MGIRVIQGDCRAVLPALPADSVHCVMTSPPYWGLRDYGVAGQIGLEPTMAEFVTEMVAVFREVRRVLRPDGTCWVNLGDSYSTQGFTRQGKPRNVPQPPNDWNGTELGGRRRSEHVHVHSMDYGSLKSKDLCGIPWRVAFALQADGWYLRQDIIWAKPNPMPESVTDRCTKSHEYLFLLTKSARYFFDAEAIKEAGEGYGRSNWNAPQFKCGDITRNHGGKGNHGRGGGTSTHEGGRNKRSVWTVATAPFSEAHFATFPPDLIEPCIKAGTSEKGCCGHCGAPWEREIVKSGGTTGKSWHDHDDDLGRGQQGGTSVREGWGNYSVKTTGWRPTCKCNHCLGEDRWHSQPIVPCTVLDPFGGAGTTGLVADRLQRNAILIELNPKYAEMASSRLVKDGGLFAQVAAE